MRSAARWKRLTKRPQQVVEVGLEPGVFEHAGEGLEDPGEPGADHLSSGSGRGSGSSWCGRWPYICSSRMTRSVGEEAW